MLSLFLDTWALSVPCDTGGNHQEKIKVMIIMVTIWVFLGARHWSKLFICMNNLILTTLQGRYHCYHLHFTEEETDTERVSDLPKVIQLVNGKVRIWTQARSLWSLLLPTMLCLEKRIVPFKELFIVAFYFSPKNLGHMYALLLWSEDITTSWNN